MTAAPALLWYGDDFTGATDTLGTAARAGLRALLFLRPPTEAQLTAAGTLDAVGLAGAARSMAPAAMRAELAPVVPLMRRLGACVLHYKLCSTFDSAPDVGSIGQALRTLRAALPAGTATVLLGGQPDLGRYCLFGNLFARAGSAGEVHRIDRHPTMARHPVTPMAEADLRRHLALQGLPGLALLPWTALRATAEMRAAAWRQLAATAPDGVLFDVADNDDLARIGPLLWQQALQAPLLAAGASGVVQALAPLIRPGAQGAAAAAASVIGAAAGPVFVLAGSLSPVTAEQVQAAVSYDKLWLDAHRLANDAAYRRETAGHIGAALGQGRSMLACTVEPGAAPPPAVDARALAVAGGHLLAEVLAARPLARVAVAGGDTSSLAVQALPAWGLSYVGALGPGVSLCRLHSDTASLDGTEIALKGGQMGAPDLFERLLHG